MNIKIVTTCLLASVLALPLAGYTADGDTDRSSPKTFVKDSVITTKVKAELAKEKPSTLVKVSVDTDRSGIVVLSGTARSQFDKDRAESIARKVSGVKTVENNISRTDELIPWEVGLPTGAYTIVARSARAGEVRVHFVIKAGQRTIVDLDLAEQERYIRHLQPSARMVSSNDS